MQNFAMFAARRLISMVIVVFAIVTAVFFLAHLSPYDPVRTLLMQKYTAANALRLRHEFGLDQPLWRQYLTYIGNLAHGNLGYSEAQGSLGQPVWDLLKIGVPISAKLGAYALLLALLIGLPAGLISALKQNTFVDHGIQAPMMVLYAIPTFVLVPICQLVFGAELKWLPVSGWGDSGVQGIKEMILPVTLYAAGIAGYFAKSFRSFLLEVLQQDYIRTAHAKGLKERIVVYRHAIKNTLLPLASIIGPTIAFLILGAFIIEYYFAIPGIGYTTVNSLGQSDYAVIEATTIVLATAVVIVNFLTDIFYGLVDPQVRL